MGGHYSNNYDDDDYGQKQQVKRSFWSSFWVKFWGAVDGMAHQNRLDEVMEEGAAELRRVHLELESIEEQLKKEILSKEEKTKKLEVLEELKKEKEETLINLKLCIKILKGQGNTLCDEIKQLDDLIGCEITKRIDLKLKSAKRIAEKKREYCLDVLRKKESNEKKKIQLKQKEKEVLARLEKKNLKLSVFARCHLNDKEFEEWKQLPPTRVSQI